MLLGDRGRARGDLHVRWSSCRFLILGLPALSGLVEVERRAGCLDLALSAPAVGGYFLRRAGAVCASWPSRGGC